MSIYVKIFGGKVVKRVIEREFKTTSDAMEYLDEFGVPPTQKGDSFDFNGSVFTLSHKIEDIRKGKPLQPNIFFTNTRAKSPTMPSKAEAIARTKIEGSASDRIEASPKDIRRPSDGKVIVLKEICREINMEPRLARQLLRKKFKGNGNQRWEWSADEALKIKEILRAK